VKSGIASTRDTLSETGSFAGNIQIDAGTLRFNGFTTPTFSPGASVAVGSAASLELAGSVSALAGGNGGVNIVNNSTAPAGILVTGVNQRAGNIDGSGNLVVNAGSDLTVNRIIQGSLVIGGSAGGFGVVTIGASDAAGNPLGSGNMASGGGLKLAQSATSSAKAGFAVMATRQAPPAISTFTSTWQDNKGWTARPDEGAIPSIATVSRTRENAAARVKALDALFASNLLPTRADRCAADHAIEPQSANDGLLLDRLTDDLEDLIAALSA
jgi:hypothetical protein